MAIHRSMVQDGPRPKRHAVVCWVGVVCLTAATSSCATPAEPEDVLEVDLVVDPDVVSSGDRMAVTLSVRNPSSDVVRMGSGDSCFALPEVWAGTERLAWEGTGLGCLSVVTLFEVNPGETVDIAFELTALLQQDQAPFDYVVRPSAGSYMLLMDMHVGLPDASVEFRVVN